MGLLLSCSKAEPEINVSGDLSGAFPPARDVNIIPDFSSVGYHYGECEIPTVPAGISLNPPGYDSGTGLPLDATEMIQKAIDDCSAGKAVVLAPGTYRVSSPIYIDRSDVVLRGTRTATDSTRIYAVGNDIRDVIVVGKTGRKYECKWVVPPADLGGADQMSYYFPSIVTKSPMADIIGELTPCGRWYVTVKDASGFTVGDDVAVYHKVTQAWLDAIVDNSIAKWTASAFSGYYTRKVAAVDGNKVYLDAPVVMQIEDGSGTLESKGQLMRYSWDRVSEVGIEDISFESWYENSEKSRVYDGKENQLNPYFCSEDHAFTAIVFGPAVNCWVRNATAKSFTQSFVNMRAGSRNITVTGCHSYRPVSYITGSRRYAFHIAGELCLVKDCICEYDRHAYVTYARTKGPNAFVNCTAIENYDELGPHQRLGTGCLYDNVSVENSASGECSNRARLGILYASGTSGRSGHGWTGSNYVLWNCAAKSALRCTSDNVHGIYNYCIGSYGKKAQPADNPEDGTWYPERNVSSMSVTSRAADRINLNSVPEGSLNRPWWPQLCATGGYSHPESLYESQLQDRLSRRGTRFSNL